MRRASERANRIMMNILLLALALVAQQPVVPGVASGRLDPVCWDRDLTGSAGFLLLLQPRSYAFHQIENDASGLSPFCLQEDDARLAERPA